MAYDFAVYAATAAGVCAAVAAARAGADTILVAPRCHLGGVYEHPRPIAMPVTEGYVSVPVPVYGIG